MKGKVITGVLAATMAISTVFSVSVAQAGAAEAETTDPRESVTEEMAVSEVPVTRKTVTVYDGEESKKQDFDCLFRDDMPNVPYVDVEQYLELIFNDTDFVMAQSGDQFVYHGEIGDKTGSNLIVDTARDTISFDKPKSFFSGEDMKKLLNIVIASVMLLPMSVSAFTAEIHEITSDNRKAVMTVWIRHFYFTSNIPAPVFV